MSFAFNLHMKGNSYKYAQTVQPKRWYDSLKKEGWNNELAAQLAGCPAKSYELTLSIVRQRLDIQPTVTFEHLAVALGSTTMLKHIHTLWDKFTTKYIDELKGAKKMNAKKELELPCWKGAVVFACAKALGVNILIY